MWVAVFIAIFTGLYFTTHASAFVEPTLTNNVVKEELPKVLLPSQSMSRARCTATPPSSRTKNVFVIPAMSSPSMSARRCI